MTLTPGKYLVIDPITDASETGASAVVRNMKTGAEQQVTDAEQIRALYDNPTAQSYGEGSYTVTIYSNPVRCRLCGESCERADSKRDEAGNILCPACADIEGLE